jgi:hypothetical protein
MGVKEEFSFSFGRCLNVLVKNQPFRQPVPIHKNKITSEVKCFRICLREKL